MDKKHPRARDTVQTPSTHEVRIARKNSLDEEGTTAVVPYRVALLTPSSCSLVFTTSRGFVAAAAAAPAVPPASSCTARLSSSWPLSSFFALSYVAKWMAVKGTFMNSCTGTRASVQQAWHSVALEQLLCALVRRKMDCGEGHVHEQLHRDACERSASISFIRRKVDGGEGHVHGQLHRDACERSVSMAFSNTKSCS